MENFKIPYKEVLAKFKKSELTIMAWRSQEMAHNMEQATQTSNTSGQGETDGSKPFPGSIPADIYGAPDEGFNVLEEKIGSSIVNKMVNKEGEIDLRQLTGDEAARYLSAMGLLTPMVPLKPGSQGIIGRG